MTVFIISGESKDDSKKQESSSPFSTTSDAETGCEIPGLKNVWDAKYCILGKLFWMGVFVACTTVMLIHVTNRVQYYLTTPVSANIQIKCNRSMKYPDVTVCNTNFWNTDRYRRLQEEIANQTGVDPRTVDLDTMLEYMDMMELWEKIAFRCNEVIQLCTIETVKPCTDVGEWNPVVSVLGICYTFRMHYPANTSGGVFGMKLVFGTPGEIRPTDTWKVLLHDQDVSPKAKLYTEGVVIGARSIVDYTIKLRQFHLLSTPLKPCSASVSVANCQLKCLSDLVLKTVHCRLPFMEDVVAPYCRPPNHTIATRLLSSVILDREGSHCPPCLPRCNSNRYEAQADTIFRPHRNRTAMKIYYETFDYTYVEQEFAYDIVSLLSDIGGTLGLFLGFSLLTIIEMVENVVLMLKKSYLSRVATETNEGNNVAEVDDSNEMAEVNPET